jgi:2-haloacid dehalogenase
MNPTSSLAVLDVNETLSDLAPLAGRFDEVGVPGDLLPTWFAATLRDGIALSASGGYAEFPQVAAGVLRPLLAQHEGLRMPFEEAVEHILAGMTTLALHPDVEPGLRRLDEAGLRVATLTNGSAAYTRDLLERAGVSSFVERTLDVGEVRRWKPAPEPYRYACRTLGVDPGAAAMIAAHPWDVHGAKRAGLRGAWLDRHGDVYPEAFDAPDVAAGTLAEVADLLAS